MLNVRFKEHFTIIDLIDEKDETSQAKEQDILDNHDVILLLHAQQLIHSDTGSRKIISRNLAQLKQTNKQNGS